jgi:hypothetical protein
MLLYIFQTKSKLFCSSVRGRYGTPSYVYGVVGDVCSMVAGANLSVTTVCTPEISVYLSWRTTGRSLRWGFISLRVISVSFYFVVEGNAGPCYFCWSYVLYSKTKWLYGWSWRTTAAETLNFPQFHVISKFGVSFAYAIPNYLSQLFSKMGKPTH